MDINKISKTRHFDGKYTMTRREKRKLIVGFRVSDSELSILQQKAKSNSDDLSAYLRRLSLGDCDNDKPTNYAKWEPCSPRRLRRKNSPELAPVTEVAPGFINYGRFF